MKFFEVILNLMCCI